MTPSEKLRSLLDSADTEVLMRDNAICELIGREGGVVLVNDGEIYEVYGERLHDLRLRQLVIVDGEVLELEIGSVQEEVTP